LNLMDLELLHNYYMYTANTLHGDIVMKTLWRLNVPQIGFCHDFVMRGILAISALHLAYNRPQTRELYLSKAIAQHQAGLRQATSILAQVSHENCAAVYIFTALTCIFALASPRKPGDFLVIGDSGIAEWLILFRGTKSIIETSQDALISGPLGPMFSKGSRRYEIRDRYGNEAFPESQRLNELTSFIEEFTSDHEKVEVYRHTIFELRKSYGMVYRNASQTIESGDIFIWLFKVSEEYLELLREKAQEALAIFAYFSVIPKRLEVNWWIEGWSTHLISRIYGLMDEEHRLWIRWPIEEIGWVPN
ncbi:hypothetical protein B0O99DRAFT_515376, partial [Bisporella sp. PMI_857]